MPCTKTVLCARPVLCIAPLRTVDHSKHRSYAFHTRSIGCEFWDLQPRCRYSGKTDGSSALPMSKTMRPTTSLGPQAWVRDPLAVCKGRAAAPPVGRASNVLRKTLSLAYDTGLALDHLQLISPPPDAREPQRATINYTQVPAVQWRAGT